METRNDPAWLAPAYFTLYLASLFVTLEGELAHWLTMVAIPVALVWGFSGGEARRAGPVLASLGLRRGRLGRAVGLALGLGLAVCLFQVAFSGRREAIVELLTSPRALVAVPVTLLFLLLTVAVTEEVFFRGYLQTRLQRLTGSRVAGLGLASLLFGVYHLPYAYLNPAWPSAGDWGAAWSAALGQGIPGGLVLGGLFLYGRGNLLAPLLLHAFVDLLPAATMLQIRVGGP